jgi:hypothetical protein
VSLTEQEIFSFLAEKFRLAAECADKLAISAKQGPTYAALRENLKGAEGAIRQGGHFREDSRWFQIGLALEECHQLARRWIVEHYSRKVFTLLADKLRQFEREAVDLRDKAPPKLGLILPKLRDDPTERPAHIQVPPKFKKTKAGLIVPTGTVH